jgi:3-deoxy-D-manno-octulosonate 8-phosphate phosphatase (KDO 8-P phosphatase)
MFTSIAIQISTTNMQFKLLILDIDGVLTDGTKSYDCNGAVVSKRYNDKDFTAIKRFVSSGVKVVFLSGDTNINQKMAEDRNVPFYYARGSNGFITKADFIELFEKEYGISKSLMAYVGDDYFDLDIIQMLDYTYCPADANPDIKRHVSMVLQVCGGHGVISDLFDVYKSSNAILEDHHSIRTIDSMEKTSKANHG